MTRHGVALAAMVLASCYGVAPPRRPGPSAASPAARLAEIARHCARIASCAHPHDPPRARDPSSCVDWWLAHEGDGDEPIPACLRVEGSCREVADCLHQGKDSRAVAYCRANPDALTGCDGSHLVSCGDDDVAESSLTDCAALEASCVEVRRAGGLLSHACVAPKVCPPERDFATCDGANVLVRCSEGAVDRVVCRAGTACRAHGHGDGEEFAMCEAPGHSPCGALGTRECDGSWLVECVAHGHYGHVRRIDCALQGLACQSTGGRAACVAEGSGRPGSEECAGATCTGTPCASGPAHCEGEALVFCAAGRSARASCAELGLGPCDPAARGPEAACTGRKEKL
jgi:hypothetical protein